MQLIEWLTRRKKALSDLTRSELRRKELMLEKDRSRLMTRVKKLAAEKQELFEKGANEKTPEIRRVLAQEFELKTTEQLMLARQLNVRSKELLTVSRLRMLRESADRARATGSKLGLVSEKDLLKITKLIETDAVKAEVYQERLDEMLRTGARADEEATRGESGSTVLDVWEKMDTGLIADTGEAFDEADRRVREEQAAAED